MCSQLQLPSGQPGSSCWVTAASQPIVFALPTKEQLGTDLKREIKLMELDIEGFIKCLEKVLSAPTIATEGLKEANEIMKKLEQKLRVEYKVLTGFVCLFV